MVEIKEVSTRKERKIFAAFNAKMYKNVPQAIPDLISDEYNNFIASRNPAFQYCKVKQFLAYKNGECVGRIAGIVNNAANEKWNTRRIRFTRFDFIDDIEVSGALLKAVEDWGREMGLEEIHGPIGFCDLDQEGMLIEGFDQEGMFITIYNHPYYVTHMEKLGYAKDVDWVEYKIMLPTESKDFASLSEVIMNKYGVKLIEPKSRREIKPYIKKVFSLINISYKDLYGTVQLTDSQIKKYYKQFILLINPEYVKLLVDKNDELVGFGLAVPSMNAAVKKSNGKLFPLGWYRILRAPFAKTKVLDLYLVGVLPKMKNKGLTAVLIHSMTESAKKNGIEFAETGPELETNRQVQALWKYFNSVQHKRRRCWIKKL